MQFGDYLDVFADISPWQKCCILKNVTNAVAVDFAFAFGFGF